jgi:hypothetical protein
VAFVAGASCTSWNRAYAPGGSIRHVRNFEASTLWRVSEYDRVRQTTGTSGFDRLTSVATVLPTSLLADLRRLDANPASNDVLEIVAACMRHRQSALLVLQHEGLVWPVTVFPAQMMYHAPIALHEKARASAGGLSDLRVLATEPAGVRAPGPWLVSPQTDPAQASHYRHLQPLLWALALDGPKSTLLSEISGTAAYRAIRSPADEGLGVPGALGSACEHLRRETVSLRTIAGWPAMNVERASRLLNGLYLASALLVSRTHPSARNEPRTGWRLRR